LGIPPAAVVQDCSPLACRWAFSPAFFNNLGEFAQAVLPRSGSSLSTELALCAKPSSASLPWTIPPLPNPPLRGECASCQKSLPPKVLEGMAFHRVDPGPFLPLGFTAQQIDHREIIVRTVTRSQPPAHEDWGIVLVQPLPEHEVNFHFFDDIVREYLLEIRHVQIRSVQRSHWGQALVRFRFTFDRDNLVAMGPQQALGFTFTVIRHNAAWNQRALYFNHKCWLILLGFPLDFWTHEHIQNAIGSFNRVLMWDPDLANATRLLVRARVTSLQEVPQFIVFSVAEGFQGVSWTVQCDIVQQFMLGAQPQDEEPVPPYPHNGHQLSVEFFGLGQPVPNFQFDLNIPPIGEIEEGVVNDNIADDGWDPWPAEQVSSRATPAPVPIVNNEEEQFSYQFSGLEDLPSDESVGLFNDIIIPQAVHFPQEEVQHHEEVVLALPAFPLWIRFWRETMSRARKI
jgi:hypothetical protein